MALIIVGMMMIALFGHLVGFTLQPVGSLKRNSTEQIKDTKVLRYFYNNIHYDRDNPTKHIWYRWVMGDPLDSFLVWVPFIVYI